MKYKEIHLWEFPKTKVFVRVHIPLRRELVHKFIVYFGSESKAIDFLNAKAKEQNLNKKYSQGSLYSWLKGSKGTAQKTTNFPLWVLIEISKVLTKSPLEDNPVMRKIEKNVEYYCSSGPAVRIYKPILPIQITPELISIIFHFFGDGHLTSTKQVSSSYRQMNRDGLRNFHQKLTNCFGNFPLSGSSLKEGKLPVPRSLSYVFIEYFEIRESNWHNARVPEHIKAMPKEFLLGGLLSFIIDDGSVGESIQIYSKNYKLLCDIQQIATKCGYRTKSIRKKNVYGKFDCFRFLISAASHQKLFDDMLQLQKDFPTCTLAHKNHQLDILVRRKLRPWAKKTDGETRLKILQICSSPTTISDLVFVLNIGNSSVREHLYKLEKLGKIFRAGKNGRHILWKTVKEIQ